MKMNKDEVEKHIRDAYGEPLRDATHDFFNQIMPGSDRPPCTQNIADAAKALIRTIIDAAIGRFKEFDAIASSSAAYDIGLTCERCKVDRTFETLESAWDCGWVRVLHPGRIAMFRCPDCAKPKPETDASKRYEIAKNATDCALLGHPTYGINAEREAAAAVIEELKATAAKKLTDYQKTIAAHMSLDAKQQDKIDDLEAELDAVEKCVVELTNKVDSEVKDRRYAFDSRKEVLIRAELAERRLAIAREGLERIQNPLASCTCAKKAREALREIQAGEVGEASQKETSEQSGALKAVTPPVDSPALSEEIVKARKLSDLDSLELHEGSGCIITEFIDAERRVTDAALAEKDREIEAARSNEAFARAHESEMSRELGFLKSQNSELVRGTEALLAELTKARNEKPPAP